MPFFLSRQLMIGRGRRYSLINCEMCLGQWMAARKTLKTYSKSFDRDYLCELLESICEDKLGHSKPSYQLIQTLYDVGREDVRSELSESAMILAHYGKKKEAHVGQPAVFFLKKPTSRLRRPIICIGL